MRQSENAVLGFLYTWIIVVENVTRRTRLDLKQINICLRYINIGVISHKIDISGVICNPTSSVQLHAVWHVLASTTALIAYIHAKSESILSINNLPLQARL